MVMDFSENYDCSFQSEVQSGFFFYRNPMMIYYKIKEEGGENKERYEHLFKTMQHF
jgi:hypothetical protein